MGRAKLIGPSPDVLAGCFPPHPLPQISSLCIWNLFKLMWAGPSLLARCLTMLDASPQTLHHQISSLCIWNLFKLMWAERSHFYQVRGLRAEQRRLGLVLSLLLPPSLIPAQVRGGGGGGGGERPRIAHPACTIPL